MKPKTLTAHQIRLATSLRACGHSWGEVASMVHATVPQLRAELDPTYRAARPAPSVARIDERAEIHVKLFPETYDRLAAEATRRGSTPEDLARLLLEVIASDEIYSAVIDE